VITATTDLTTRLRALPIGGLTAWMWDAWGRRWAVLRLSHNVYEVSLNGRRTRGGLNYVIELMEECTR
jgi:hypothetical protein